MFTLIRAVLTLLLPYILYFYSCLRTFRKSLLLFPIFLAKYQETRDDLRLLHSTIHPVHTETLFCSHCTSIPALLRSQIKVIWHKCCHVRHFHVYLRHVWQSSSWWCNLFLLAARSGAWWRHGSEVALGTSLLTNKRSHVNKASQNNLYLNDIYMRLHASVQHTWVVTNIRIDRKLPNIKGLNDICVPLLSVFNVMENVIHGLSWHILAHHPTLREEEGQKEKQRLNF